MAENKILKGINFPGLEETYYIPEATAVEYEDGYIEIQSYVSDAVEVANLDTTLTKEGYAADAKAVGEALSAKAPAGYGLGETGSRLLELADIDGTRARMIPTGWYHLEPMLGGITIDGYKMNPVGVRVEPYSGGYMMITIIHQGQPVVRRNFVTGTWGPWEWTSPPMKVGVEYRTTERIDSKAVYKKKVDGEILYRLDGETKWRHQNDLVGAAPAVYTYPSGVNGIDANTIVNEYHKFVINCANCAYDHGFLDVDKASGEGFSPTDAGPIIQQTMRDWRTGDKAYRTSVDNGATWGEWIYETPPLVHNLEYRTTERLSNSPVYARYIHMGSIPANGEITADVGIAANKVVSLEIMSYSSAYNVAMPLPHMDSSNGSISMLGWISGGVIHVKSLVSFTGYSAFAIIKYTK